VIWNNIREGKEKKKSLRSNKANFKDKFFKKKQEKKSKYTRVHSTNTPPSKWNWDKIINCF
jgi:hypothetical protein